MSDPAHRPPPAPPQDTGWLLQYYTDSKTHEPLTGQEPTESPPCSLHHIATPPAEKYTLADEIGVGGMKTVRRARDANANRDVAMALLQEGKQQPRFIRRFVREARITAALEHPNIVPVHEIGVDPAGRPYFTMKLLGGETLQTILKKLAAGDPDYRRRYPLNRLLQIFLGAGNAVDFAHSRGVIHLDLKPANIQVGDFGEVLVLDWGLAKILDRPGSVSLPEELRVVHTEGTVRGTPGFMAPEQVRGEYSQFDERTDIYALGVILYCLLTGQLPASATSTDTPAAPSPPTSHRRLPPALLAVARKAMAERPEDRYPSVRELLRDIQAFLAGYATSAQQASALTLLGLLIKRQKTLAASLLIILLIGIVAFIRIARSERATRAALERIELEQAANRRLGLLAAPRVLQQASDLLRACNPDAALEQLDFALALDSSLAAAWNLKAAFHLGSGEYALAVTNFDCALPASQRRLGRDIPPAERPRNVDELAWRYYRQPPTNDLQVVADICRLTKPGQDLRQAALIQFFLRRNRQTPPDWAFINETMRLLNPDSQRLSVTGTDTEEGLSVTVRGEKITSLLPLAGLPIAQLDLSGTGSPDLAPLRTLPLVALDLSGTTSKDLSALTAIPTLAELRLVKWPRENYVKLRQFNQLTRVIVDRKDAPHLEADLTQNMRKPPVVIGE
jgi:serine/threonine protein kinase